MIYLGERWKTTLKSFGSCIGGMVFKPFWHTAKLCLVLTKTSACLTRLKVLRPRGSANPSWVAGEMVVNICCLKTISGWDLPLPIASGLYKLGKCISEKLCSPIQYTTSGTWIYFTPFSRSKNLICRFHRFINISSIS